MSGPALALLGVVLGGVGWLLLRSTADGWRIGRLLAAAPQRSLAEAAAQAARGDVAYVRIHGRIDSDEEFPGRDGAALVFQRRRLQRGQRQVFGGITWQTFDDQRLAVPFGLAERGERITVDVDALADGLIVVPGVSVGVAADLVNDAAAQGDGQGREAIDVAAPQGVAGPWPGMDPGAPVRLRVEHVATTDHATAAGVPRLGAAGETVLGPGLGRPLILTTLDLDEAMRVLGSGRRARLVTAGGLLMLAPILVSVGLVVTALGW